MKKIILTLMLTCALPHAALAENAAPKSLKNSYVNTPLVANKASYKPQFQVDEKFINGWGIAIRPAGAGGHFWVTAKDISFEYVGDVTQSSDPQLRGLHTDDVKYVKLPVGGDENFATGVVFSGSDKNFVITQQFPEKTPITAPAKFLFASDGGIISAWTERKLEDGTFDRPAEAVSVIDYSQQGSQFFGLAISKNFDRLYAADFGKAPTIHSFDNNFKPLTIQFDQPFDDNKNGKVDAGEYAPFNIQHLGESLFVAYAKTQACPDAEIAKGTCEKGAIFVGEEDTSKPGYGRLAEFTENGKLIALWNDQGKLSAPWGVVFAPENFGSLSGHLLVANFGDGTISAFDPVHRNFKTTLNDSNGKPIVVDKIWGLLFGNGESLGDKNALYYAAGPEDETDGVFGSLRYKP